MAELPTFSELQQLTNDPRTQALDRIPGAIQGAVSLADSMKQRQLQRQQALLKLQQEVAQIKATSRAAQLAVPVTPQTPVSNEVPQAALGQIATPQASPSGELTAQPTPQLPQQIEEQRPAAFQAAAIQAQPKTAINDILKQQMTSAKPQAYKPYGLVEKEGKQFAVEIGPMGDFRTTEIPAGTEVNSMQYAKVRDKQVAIAANNNLTDSLSLKNAPTSIRNADTALGTLVRFNALEEFGKKNGLTPQELTEISRQLDALVSTRPTVSITKELTPIFAKAKVANYQQFLSSNPSPILMKEFLQRLDKVRQAEIPKIQEQVKTYRIKEAASKGQAVKQFYPSLYRSTLNAWGVKPSEVDQAARNQQSQFPSSVYGGGSNPEDRVNELIANGLDEEAAHEQAAQEAAQAEVGGQ